jgi:hypothetical protein
MNFRSCFSAKLNHALRDSALCLLALASLIGCKISDKSKHAAFPWPPPTASDRITLPLSVGGPGLKTAGELDQRILSALDRAGYVQRAHYAVPNGYVLVTRAEQIEKDGSSAPSPYRFSDQIPPPHSLTNYLAGLFTSRPGYYRIIVFVATAVPFNDTAPPLREDEARQFLLGPATLPAAVAAQQLSPATKVTALIYEYQKSGTDASSPATPIHSTVEAKVHLQQAGLWKSLSAP